ncbi:MAG: hypothetical protein RQ899_01895 [Pseudomonadales bacterium]|nr:hypothetical protein [Pseudomonadales bacterium]
MFIKNRSAFVLSALLSGFPTLVAQVSAQEPQLNLFEDTEANTPRRVQGPTRRGDAAGNTNPAFTLQGTGRFGDEYHSILLSRDGQVLTVRGKKGESSQLPGHAGYRVMDVGSRSLSLQLPETEACVDARDKGVSCSEAGNIAVLTLSTAEPIPSRQLAANDASEVDAGEQSESGGAFQTPEATEGTRAAILNPFSGEPQIVPQISEEERAARAQRQAARAERLSNFQPVTIPDSEVPPGMRVVRTPFGDRLVPEQ